MEQRKRGRAKYHNFQGCRRGQFSMVFILSNPPLLSFFLTTLYEMRKEKNFHFFCIISFIHYLLLEIWLREKQARYRDDCFLLLVWHNNGCNGLLLLPQNSSSGERELAQCLLCPAVSWYLEARDDDIHRSYTRWPCIVSNVVIYILP